MSKQLSNREAYIKELDKYLEQRKMRKTPERIAILNRLLTFQAHFTIDQLMQAMEQENFHVSLATLYNTVDLLLEAGLVRRHVFEGMLVQYEKAGVAPHSHLICTTCGKIKEVRDNNFVAYMNAKKYTAFNTDHYSLYVYGTCSTCARRQKKRSTDSVAPKGGKNR